MAASTPGIFEIVDNDEYGQHRDALRWLAAHYARPIAVATGYIGLDGLDTLAQAAERRPVRLLIGAVPDAEELTGSSGRGAVRDRFRQSVGALRRERDFSGFPASRRNVLERVSAFVASDNAQVRRYTQRFLHGKAYLLGSLNDTGALDGPGAALVTSANLTAAGLSANLELGMVHYQPNVGAMAFGWHERLWDEAEDFREELLDLLRPPPLDASPEDVFLRALIELYGRRTRTRARRRQPHELPARWRSAGAGDHGSLRRRPLRRRRRHGQDGDRRRPHPRARRGAGPSRARDRLRAAAR